MKKLFALVLAVMLLMSAFATAEGLKIGMAVREVTNDYNRDIIGGAQAVIEAAGGEFVVTDAQADYQKHLENIENLINSDIDGLLIQLGDATQMAPLCEKAEEKGIPVITIGVGDPVAHTYTDFNGDDSLMTALAADALMSAINYSGDVYVVYVPGAPLLETRRRIFYAIAETYADVTVHDIPAEHNPTKVQTSIEELLIANPDPGSIAGIFGTYDLLISGGVEAIRRAGRGEEIPVVSIDGDLIGFQMLLQEGSPFVATVAQDAPGCGSNAATMLLGILDGTWDVASIAPKTPATCFVATRRNIVEAAELRWGETFWEDTGYDKAEVAEMFPQTDTVLVNNPTLP